MKRFNAKEKAEEIRKGFYNVLRKEYGAYSHTLAPLATLLSIEHVTLLMQEIKRLGVEDGFSVLKNWQEVKDELKKM